MRARWLRPPMARTIGIIGDTHFGHINMTATRKAMIQTDLIASFPNPLAFIHVGDVVAGEVNDPEDDYTALDAEANDWLDEITAATGSPWYAAIGNHDIWQNTRDRTDFEAVYGPANRVIDLGRFKVIIVSPDTMEEFTGVGDAGTGDTSKIKLTAATLTWLDAQLAATSKDCLIVGHAPLKNTFIADHVGDVDSNDDPFYIGSVGGVNDVELRAVIADHANAKAFISGHTHPNLWYSAAADAGRAYVKAETIGSHTVAAINVPAPAYTGGTAQYNIAASTAVTYYPDRIEVRWRDHNSRMWDAPYDAIAPKTVHVVEL